MKTKLSTTSLSRVIPAWTLALALPLWLSAVPAHAQAKGGSPHSGASSHGASGSGGGRAVSGGGGGGGTRMGSGGGRTTSSGGSVAVSRGAATGDGSTPAGARARNGNQPIVGTAVSRGTVRTDHGTVIVGGYYPGYYGYYPGFYSPFWYGGYDGYYGYYDPWFGGYPLYTSTYGTYTDEGYLRLKIKPKEAEVFVDGYYVGIVDDYNGFFQKLHLESGAHHVEVREEGYEPLSFDVRITPDHKTTYQGDLKKIQ